MRTGSGIYYHNVICQLNEQTSLQQAALYALPNGQTAEWIKTDTVFPVLFDTCDLPFPIAGMSDEMPYPSTVYHKMNPNQIDAWKKAFRSELIKAKQLFQPDAIICHHLWMLCRVVLDVFPNKTVIAISHGTDIRQARQNPDMCAREVGSLKKLKHVFALSSQHVDDLCRYFDLEPSQIIATGGAIDSSVFYPRLPLEPRHHNDQVRFVYAGKMTQTKGTHELVDAFHLAHLDDPNIRLDLIGRATPALRQKMETLTDSSIFRLFDVKSQLHLADHLRQADVFVLASYYEGLGLVALEALASGLSLVVNGLQPLIDQLGPNLAKNPCITWVDMPQLATIDMIDQAAKPAYIQRLAKAILLQANRRRGSSALCNHPHKAISMFSWKDLSRRLLQHIRLG